MKKIISSVEAYKIALSTLKTFEYKWQAYVQEDARQLYCFEDD